MAKINFENTDAPTPPAPDAPALAITKAAAQRVGALLAQAQNGETFFRCAVIGGGCNGFSYHFSLESTKNKGDHTLTHEAQPQAPVLVDDESFNMLRGATLDFEETLAASQFIVRNPNAKSSCGCGSSFSF